VFGAAINGRPVRASLNPELSFSQLYGLPNSTQSITVEHSGAVGPDDAARGLSDEVAALDSVSVGEETIQHAKIRLKQFKFARSPALGTRVLEVSAPTPTVELGADFMKAHRLLYAPAQHLLYMTYAGGPVYQLGEPVSR
jgi:hypothetical protein